MNPNDVEQMGDLIELIEAVNRDQRSDLLTICLTFCSIVVFGVIAYLYKIYNERQSKKIELAFLHIFEIIKEFLNSVIKLKNSIDTLPFDILRNKDAKKLDERITFPSIEVESRAIFAQLFLNKEMRAPLERIIDETSHFRYSVSQALYGVNEIERMNSYDLAKMQFTKNIDNDLSSFIDLMHINLLGRWKEKSINWHKFKFWDKSKPTESERYIKLSDTIATLQDAINVKSETIATLTAKIKELESQLKQI